MISVFGYGSLINQDSLERTINEQVILTPAILHGYKRVFEVPNYKRMCIDDQPTSALNIIPDPGSHINGVLFDVSDNQLQSLVQREITYDIIELTTEIYDPHALVKHVLSTTFIDRSSKKQPFIFNDSNQLDYLTLCLEGAKKISNDFYLDFLSSTFIDAYSLADLMDSTAQFRVLQSIFSLV